MVPEELESLIEEVNNKNRVPYHKMGDLAREILQSCWKRVERYSRDACKWVPNDVNPRNWESEAYRVPEWKG
jgi:hypothetical protein